MKKTLIPTIALGMMLGLSSGAYAVPVTDVVETPTGYFVPSDAQKYDSPYYRWNGEDWGWTHNAITGGSTASLLISAFDVDFSSGERDMVSIYDNSASSWVNLGYLAGSNDVWDYTSFDVTSYLDDINSGLQVKLTIDETNAGWAVTLAKSALSVDGGTVPNPTPTVPEPASMLLMGVGIACLGATRRRVQV